MASNQEKFLDLMSDFNNYEYTISSADWIREVGRKELIESLTKLKPTKVMLQNYGYDSLKDLIDAINDNLSL